jgi:quinol monooxygenase YgiN
MIFIVVKFAVRPEASAGWLDLVRDFTDATRREPGNLFFEWSRSVDDPHCFVLVEAFADAQAGERHVQSQHFADAMIALPRGLAATPQIVNVEVPGDGWSTMAELAPVPA